MKRTIAAVLVAIVTILCIGGGYSESDALSGGIEAEEIIPDQLPEPEQESEEDMATGDKLVNLDDLKVAYDKQQEDTNSIKSALEKTTSPDFITNPGFYINGKIGETGQKIGTGGNSLIIYSISALKGRQYRVTASNIKTLSDNYAFLAFSTNELANNAPCTVLVNGSTTSTSFDYSYEPEENGYLYLVKGADASMTFAFYETGIYVNEEIEALDTKV